MPASDPSSRNPRSGALIRVLRRFVAATPGLTLTSALRQAGISTGKAYWMNRAGAKLTFRTAAELALAVGAPVGQFLEAVAWEMGLHPRPAAPHVLCRLPLARSRGPGRPRKSRASDRGQRSWPPPEDQLVEVVLPDPPSYGPSEASAAEQGCFSAVQGEVYDKDDP
jgi:hypothetical protein